MPDLRVEEQDSGIAVVYDVEAASEARREARRARRQEKRRKAAQGRTAAQKGMSTWKARSKRIGKLARQIERDHPEADARETAKVAVRIGEDITEYAVGTIVRHVVASRAEN